MLERIRALAAKRANFAFETTLAGRSYAHYIDEWTNAGFDVNLLYLWLRSPEVALDRISRRVRLGGHSIPEDTVRHRYQSSIENLVSLFVPRCGRWSVYDNSNPDCPPSPVAHGSRLDSIEVLDENTWNTIQSQSRSSS